MRKIERSVKIHILSDRRSPFSSSPLLAVPLLQRSGFVQSALRPTSARSSALRAWASR
jgi:hypothetical protein